VTCISSSFGPVPACWCLSNRYLTPWNGGGQAWEGWLDVDGILHHPLLCQRTSLRELVLPQLALAGSDLCNNLVTHSLALNKVLE
jgi:hypothetical protein